MMNNYNKLLEYANPGDNIEFEYHVESEDGNTEDNQEQYALIKGIINIIEVDLLENNIYISLGGGNIRYKGIEDDKGIIKFTDYDKRLGDCRTYGFFDISKIEIIITRIRDIEWEGFIFNK